MREVNFEPILSPLKVIDAFFRNQPENTPTTQAITDLIRAQTDGFSTVPWLIPEALPFAQNCQLVRLRGMIQDMPGTEPYLERCKTQSPDAASQDWLYGRYRDKIQANEEGEEVVIDDAHTVLNDRHVLIVTCNSPAQSDLLKSETIQHSQRQWAQLRDSSESANRPTDVKLPTAIVVKCYEDLSAKLNDVYDFVGILSTETCIQPPAPTESQNIEVDLPWYYREPVLTLHAVSAEKLSKSCDFLRPFVFAADCPLKVNVDVRNRLIDALAYVLSGDRLAAEFLLCHLVSSAYGRSGPVVLGTLSVNVCGISPQADGSCPTVQRMCDLFQKILSNVEVLRISIPELNKVPSENGVDLLPKFIPNETRLKRGRLQLPRGSQILINETTLEAGKLDENGIRVLTALEDIAQFQRMYYDFVYYNKEFDAEYNVAVFSDYKSLVKCTLTIPTVPTNPPPQPPNFEPVDYCQMAAFLASARDAVNDFELPPQMQELIANDFANVRKEAGSVGFSPEDLSTMIVLARWLTITNGLRELNEEIWSTAKSMERERRTRLSSFTKRPANAPTTNPTELPLMPCTN